jgi:GTP pyrophosphokinase
VDFAYSIHTEVGHRCVGAKVNGRMVSLRHVLQNGDRVEILTRADHRPSRDWLAFVKSASAKSRIQAFIREEERIHAIAIGRDRLEREARSAGIHLEQPETHAQLEARLKELKLPNWESFYASVGFNRISVHRLLEPLLPETHHVREVRAALLSPDDTVLVDDNIGVLYILAQCCKPIRGDEIVGYTTRGRGISIHRSVCPHLNTSAINPERRVNVAWGKQGKGLFDTEIAITTEDRPGMVTAISNAIQHAGINMQRFNASTAEGGAGLFHIALRVRDRNHIVEIMSNIRRVRGVYTVERVRGSIFGSVR